MKYLYRLSFLLWAPLMIVGSVFGYIGDGLQFVAMWIHDETTVKAWSVLHSRECARNRAARSTSSTGGVKP